MRVTVCARCGAEFYARTKMTKYCSEKCRKDAADEQKRNWYVNKKTEEKTLGEQRAKRIADEKRRRIRESVRLAVEMGLRSPD